MGNCLSMFSVDKFLIYDQLLQNLSRNDSGFNKKVMTSIYKGTYAGMRNNYGKFSEEEEVRLQTGKWWNELF